MHNFSLIISTTKMIKKSQRQFVIKILQIEISMELHVLDRNKEEKKIVLKIYKTKK